MREAIGVVTLNDAPTKAKLTRFCQKKIDQWLETRAIDEPLDDEFDFTVSFMEERETHQVSCETEIRVRGQAYRGCDLGSDTQQALIQCLKRLQPH